MLKCCLKCSIFPINRRILLNAAQPLVSIIMSSYNNQRDVEKALNSVLKQSYPHWELVISDDASGDHTKDLIDGFTDPRIKRFHSDLNQGIVKQMNKLFAEAKGDFITILDADDMIAPNKLELQIKAFQEDPALTLCFTRVAICDENDHVLSITDHYPEEDIGIKTFIKQRAAFPCGNLACMMFRATELLKYGGYQAFFEGIGSWDIDLALRILSTKNSKAITLPFPLHYWRKHSLSFSRKVNLNPMKSQSHQFAHLLYHQRLQFEKDDLTGLGSGELEKLILKIRDDYKSDPSRIYREIAKSKDQPKSVRLHYGVEAIKLNPLSFTNYRYLVKALITKR